MSTISWSSADSCEGQFCPSEGCNCGCHGKVTLGKHPSSNPLCRSNESVKKQIPQAISKLWSDLTAHLLSSSSIVSICCWPGHRRDWEQPGQTEKNTAARCFCLCPQNLQQARSQMYRKHMLQNKSLSSSLGNFEATLKWGLLKERQPVKA